MKRGVEDTRKIFDSVPAALTVGKPCVTAGGPNFKKGHDQTEVHPRGRVQWRSQRKELRALCCEARELISAAPARSFGTGSSAGVIVQVDTPD
jgi:hypothetical protein